MSNTIYASSDDCDWWHNEDLADAVDEYIDSNFEDISIGSIITVYQGEILKRKASWFAPRGIAEQMNECAYDDIGESAESWIDSKKEAESLQEAVLTAIDSWADKNSAHPKFGEVTNIVPVRIQITEISESTSDWVKL